MEITFNTKRLAERCNDTRKGVRAWGADRARRVRRRLDDLRAAETLSVMEGLPGRCHELKGSRAGILSLDLDHPYRLLFRPATDPAPTKADGGLDWTAVKAVEILGIEDTHE